MPVVGIVRYDMTLADDFASGDELLSEAFGSTSVSYITMAGDVTDLEAIKSAEMDETQETDGITVKLRVCHLSWLVSDLADVDLRSTITMEDEEWSIVEVLGIDPLRITVKVQRHELYELSRAGYRRQL